MPRCVMCEEQYKGSVSGWCGQCCQGNEIGHGLHRPSSDDTMHHEDHEDRTLQELKDKGKS